MFRRNRSLSSANEVYRQRDPKKLPSLRRRVPTQSKLLQLIAEADAENAITQHAASAHMNGCQSIYILWYIGILLYIALSPHSGTFIGKHTLSHNCEYMYIYVERKKNNWQYHFHPTYSHVSFHFPGKVKGIRRMFEFFQIRANRFLCIFLFVFKSPRPLIELSLDPFMVNTDRRWSELRIYSCVRMRTLRRTGRSFWRRDSQLLRKQITM